MKQDQQQAIAQSPNDDRDYRSIELENGLVALLISDPETDKAAAALDVATGSGSDPDDRQGLAHFLEHMLFLGTEKYPQPDEYQSFINQHGGSHNAYTSYDHTNYFFDVDARYLEPALDRFSQQFVAPLFSPQYVDREKNAVHSEYTAKLKDDSRRFFSVLKEGMNPAHPLSRFAVGTLETLADPSANPSPSSSGPVASGDPVRHRQPVHADLLEFYQNHYSAHIMRLVVYGRESLDELEAMTRSRFSAVIRRDHVQAQNAPDVAVFPAERLPQLITMQPVKEKRSLNLLFPMPPALPHYHSKPLYYLSHLIGHEGEGSLLSRLKKARLAESLSAGLFSSNEQEAIFSISISLTPQGRKAWPEVMDTVFDYIELMREHDIARWRIDELATMLDVSFRFKEKSAPMHYVSGLAGRLHEHPPEEVLQAPYLMDEYRPELIREFLDHLEKKNVVAVLVAPDAPVEKQDPWYETPYAIRPLTESLGQGSASGETPESADADTTEPTAAQSGMRLPDRNPFIPENLHLHDGNTMAHPEPLAQSGADAGPYPPGRMSETAASRQASTQGAERTSAHAAEGHSESARSQSGMAPLTAWYALDTSFGVPKSSYYVSLRTPVAKDSARDVVLTELLVSMAREQLAEYSYPAYLAGLEFKLYKHQRGITIRIDGFSEKQHTLLAEIVDTLKNLDYDEQRFSQQLHELKRDLRNSLKNKPFERLATVARSFLVDPWYSEQAQLEAASTLTIDDLKSFASRFWAEMDAVSMAVGNLTPEEAKAANLVIERQILEQAMPSVVPKNTVADLQGGLYFHRESLPHSDSAYLLYLQGASKAYQDRALVGLISQIAGPGYYNQIRTEAQMGYVVFATPFTLMEVPGLAFIVQSPSHRPEQIHEATRHFLTTLPDMIENMAEEDLERHKQSLINKLEEDDQTLEQRASRFWTEIDVQNADFDTVHKIAAEVDKLDRDTLVKAVRERFLGRPESLMIVAVPENSKAEWVPDDAAIIGDREKFIQTTPRFPDTENRY